MAVQDLSIPYTLQNLSTGYTAVFNDLTDPNYVGVLTDISGIDSPEIRESADDLVQADGGIHGDFFYGRRPVTLSGMILNPASTTDRAQKVEKLMRASDSLRTDSILAWTPPGGVKQYLVLRRQQPLRVTGAWQKSFQLQMVAANPRIVSDVSHTASSTGQIYNLINNPRAYNDAANWAAGGGTATIVRDLTYSPYGSAAFKFSGSVTANVASMFSNAWAHAAGQPISAAAMVNVFDAFNNPSNPGRIRVQFDDGSNTWSLASGGIDGPITGAATGLRTISVLNAVAPSGTTQARLRLMGETSGTDTFDWRVSAVFASKSADLVDYYFDGSSGYGYRWLGGAHNSISAIDGKVVVYNAGTTSTPVLLRVDGPATTFTLINDSTGEAVTYSGTLTAAQNVSFDTSLKTVLLGNGSNQYANAAFLGFRWINLAPGYNLIRYAAPGYSAATSLVTATWRDAWM